MADLSIKILIDGVNNASNAIKSAMGDLEALDKQAKPLNDSLNQLSASFVQVGIAAAGLSAALGTAFGAAVKSASDFNYGMANVQSILQINSTGAQQLATDMSDLTAKAAKLGLDTQFTAVQAAGAMTELARAGYDATKILQTTPAVLDLASASGVGLAQTAEWLVNVMNPFKLSADQAGQAANTLAVVASSASLTFSDLAEAMKYAAPAAAAVGLTINETAAIMGALGDAGIKASMGGTALRGMLTDLAAPTKKATDTLNEMHVQIQRTADGSVDFLATMQKLGEANLDLGQATRIFGVHQATAALVVAQSTDKIREYTDRTYTATDALTKMRETMENTLSRAFVMLQSSLEGLAIALGSPLLEPLRVLVMHLVDALNAVSEFAKAHETLTKYLMGAVGVFALVAGAVAAFSLALAALIKTVQFVIGALQTLAAVKNTELLTSIRQSITATLEEAAAHRANTTALQAEAAAAKSAAAAKATGGASGVLGSIGGKLGGAATGALAFSAISSGIAAATDQTNKWGDSLTLIGSILSFIPTPLTKILGVVAMVGGGIVNLVSSIGVFKTSVDTANNATSQTVASVSKLDSATQSMVKSAVDAGQSWAEFKQSYLEAFGKQPPDEVAHQFLVLRQESQAANQAAADAMSKIGGAADLIGAKVGDAQKTAAELKKESEQMARDLTWAFQQLHQQSAMVFDEMTKTVQKSTDEWKNALKIDKAVDTEDVTKAFGKMTGDMGKSISTMVEMSNGRLGVLKDRLQQAMSAGATQKEIDAMTKGIEAFASQAIKKWEEIGKSAGESLKELSSKYSEVLTNINKLSDDMAKQQIKDTDTIAKARTAANESAMTDLQKYNSRMEAIKAREAEIQQLVAEGGEENLKRARELTEQNIQDQTKLKEVKQSYISLYPEEAAKIQEQIRALEQISGKTQEEKNQLQTLKDLYKDKVTIVDKNVAASERNKVINQAENDLATIRNKQEEEKSSELESQKKALEEQIAKMKEQQQQAEQTLAQFRQAIAVTLDTSGAMLQMEELFKNRVIKATIDIQGAATQARRFGGMIHKALRASVGAFVPGGYGGGDVVPAWLEPGEFVFRKEVVKALGPNWFENINRSMGRIQGFAQGGMIPRYADGGTVQLFNLEGFFGGLVDSLDNLSSKLSTISGSGGEGSGFGDEFAKAVSDMDASNKATQSKMDQLLSRLGDAAGSWSAPIKIDVAVQDGKGTASVETF